MSKHNCYRCGQLKIEYREMRTILKTAIRQMENRPGTPQAEAAQERVTYAKAQLAKQAVRWEEHLAEVADEPEKPRKILDVRPVKKPKPIKAPKTTIDPAALQEALAELSQAALMVAERGPQAITPTRGTKLPATGRCHTCDRPISGERRFCGPCAARRES